MKQYLANGLVVDKIHRILRFRQSKWLKPYIDLNTDLRRNSKDEFGKVTFKTMINAVYGKTMENLRKHRIVKLAKSWDGRYGAKHLISSPSFHNRTIFDEMLMTIEMKKNNILFNKSLYIV